MGRMGLVWGDLIRKVARHVRLLGSTTLDDPEIVSLMNAALPCASVPLDPKRPRRLMIKSISARQRPAAPTKSRLALAREIPALRDISP